MRLNKNIGKVVVLAAIFSLTSCSLMPKEHRFTRNQDFFNRFSKHTLVAVNVSKLDDDYLVLRKNKTFVYRTKFFGILNISYFTGTYSLTAEGLTLNFLPGQTSTPIDEKYKIELEKASITLEGNSSSFTVVNHRSMDHLLH
jgi:hypothetical protein